MVTQSTVENHGARRGESAHRLFDRNWFLEGKQRASFVQTAMVLRSAHDDQRDRGRAPFRISQFAQELEASIQIAVNDEGVNLGFAKAGQSRRRFVLDG